MGRLRVSSPLSKEASPPDGWRKQSAAGQLFNLAQEVIVAEGKTAALMPPDSTALAPRWGALQQLLPVRDSTAQSGHVDQPVARACQMRLDTGVGPIFSAAAQRRPHRIQQDVARCRVKVPVVHGKGSETPLPKAPFPSFSPVDHRGIAPVRDGQRSAQPSWICWHGHQVNMVGKEAVRPDGHLFPLAVFGQEVAVDLVVESAEEGRLAPIASLGHVMRQARDDESSDSGHFSDKDEFSASNLAPARRDEPSWMARLCGPFVCPANVSLQGVPAG